MHASPAASCALPAGTAQPSTTRRRPSTTPPMSDDRYQFGADSHTAIAADNERASVTVRRRSPVLPAARGAVPRDRLAIVPRDRLASGVSPQRDGREKGAHHSNHGPGLWAASLSPSPAYQPQSRALHEPWPLICMAIEREYRRETPAELPPAVAARGAREWPSANVRAPAAAARQPA